jgi:site-specific DNA-methyltransferase (adenine-specific)
MRGLEGQSVNCVVTSPPYFGLRDYGHDGQIGLEASPDAFVTKLVDVFREVRRVLRDDGTLWLNLGDSYASRTKGSGGKNGNLNTPSGNNEPAYFSQPRKFNHDVKDKDLLGIPWRVAFALQADGWYLRQDIIWHKPNPMPESVRDRCTKAHEYIFLLSKAPRYYFDAEAIKEPAVCELQPRKRPNGLSVEDGKKLGVYRPNCGVSETRNRRSVWTVATKPFNGAHFATFPPDLIRPCILAGCPKDGTVLDPFGGSGTTALVALEEGRKAVLCELNTDYIALAHKRLEGLQLRIA